MSSSSDMTEMLTMAIVIIMTIIAALVYVYWLMARKEKKKNEEEIKPKPVVDRKQAKKDEYTRLSVFNFMEFDKIEDNMIIEDNGKKFLMVVECEGINYDLMSSIEKTAVEAGFVQFLNTLRHPIQIYTQTRTIKIESSIENYRSKLRDIKMQLDAKQREYQKLRESNRYTKSQLQDARLEVIRMQNMYDYGQDVVNNIEQMSQNKNVLRKHYYIIVPYYASEIEGDSLSEEEKQSMIFSELYTRAQSVIRTLFACSMKCRILDSEELADLLYVAYNREDSEIYGIDKALMAGYDEFYSTAEDVLDKKMRALDEEIERKAEELARNTIDDIKSEKELKIMKKEQTFEEIVAEMAKVFVKQNKNYIGEKVANEAIEKIDNKKTKEKEEVKNVQKAKKTRATKNA